MYLIKIFIANSVKPISAAQFHSRVQELHNDANKRFDDDFKV